MTDQPWRDAAEPPDKRATALQQAMTFEDKVALALSDFAAVARLGIPPLVYADGPNGVRDPLGVTAFPATIALAATFDRSLADAYGAALGSEIRRAGRNVLLGPAVDIARTPLGGRAAESMGEDPYLAAALVAPEVRAVQAQHVVAMPKHFVANNFEHQRIGFGSMADRGPAVDVLVGDRALQEIYLPPVRRALLTGGALSVMGSYNQLNGTYVCESPALMALLKDDWGWPGFVAPDFMFAVRDDLAAARAGLDVGALDGPGRRTADDFTTGRIPADRLEDMVGRILYAMFAGGLFDHPIHMPADPISTPEHVDVATRVAQEGMVLLVNRGGVLPLFAPTVTSIAVIGPAGEDALFTIGGSGSVALTREHIVTPLAGMLARAGSDIEVRHIQGSRGDVRLPVLPADVLTTCEDGDPGLRATFWQGDPDGSEPVRTEVVPVLDLYGNPPGLEPPWSARWTGVLTPPADGAYRFSVTLGGMVELSVDGELVASGAREAHRMGGGPEVPLQGVAHMQAGRPVEIRVEYRSGPTFDVPAFKPVDLWGQPEERGLLPSIQLGWQPPDGQIAAAATLAAESDVAVVLVQATSGEGSDRTSLVVPGDQDNLVRAVTAANPRTVVVLNTSGPVLMPWLDAVAAVVQAWYPGQQFGEALAAVLFGDVDPGGRLPVTFPATVDQGPTTQPERYPGVDGVARYDEGILVGYRFYDANRQEPLFPFGHGLSYTTYEYGPLAVTVQPGAADVAVEVDVTNVGSRPGTEVVQLYLGFPSEADEPPRQLKGFVKVALDPGATEQVGFALTADELAAFREADGQWVVHPGRYDVLVGASSRDIRSRSSFDLPADA